MAHADSLDIVTDRPYRVRFAPSPTGYFHVGGARTALYNWILARQHDGTFVLRIEDTDEARNRPEWTEGILDALDWIGIRRGTYEGPYFQSARADRHREAAETLYAAGAAYYCDCTREEIDARAKAAGRAGYDGHCRDRGLEPAEGRALRFKVPRPGSTTVVDLIRGHPVFDHATIEDFVILRGNRTAVFLLANVVDDLDMAISHVVRAEEHLPNTPKAQLMWQALSDEPPPVWAHVPVLVNEKRQKLSKRRDAVAVEMYRDEGYLADAMRNYLMLLGWAPSGDREIVPWEVIEREFRLEDVNSSPAFFDVKKLRAFNAEYIRALPVEEFTAACEPWLVAPNAPWSPQQFDANVFVAMAPLVQTRIHVLSEVPEYVDFLFLDEPPFDETARAKALTVANAPVLDAIIAAYQSLPTWQAADLQDAFRAVAEVVGLKPAKVDPPLRVAVTGRTIGPPLFEALELLGRERTLARLRSAREGIAA
jgi:glutamyl-tRNA synthetase